MLRYPHDWPESPAQEKGVDVAIATDLVSLALRDQCDIAVVASADSDLIPAIEEVQNQTSVKIEVAAWRGAIHRQRLSVSGPRVWCHWLTREDYEQVRDGHQLRRRRCIGGARAPRRCPPQPPPG